MDLYILLGVNRAATLEDIKRAYRRLARKYHPDINPGDRTAAQHFRRIAEAYATLSDPERRHRYDRGDHLVETSPSTTFGFEGFDFSMSASGSSASTFGDLFADVLRQRHEPGGSGAPERGADIHATITLSFEEAVRGGSHELRVTRQTRCRACRGAGRVETAETRCSCCHGTGVVKSVRGHMVFSKACAYCAGTGLQAAVRCTVCGGRQVEMRAESLSIQVPVGLSDGDRIQVPGQGHAGYNGGWAGDLHVTVRVQPHPVFRREGDDLHVVVPVAIHEAALGAKVSVPALDGDARLRVPPGTQSGQRFRLRGRGVQSPRDGRRGDLVVEVRLVLPKVLDERSKELLREFGRINGAEDARREMNGDERRELV